MHLSEPIFLKILGVAIAVGFDTLAISVGVGVLQPGWKGSIRLGAAFSGAEIFMQFVGYEIGNGAAHIFGDIAAYTGFAILAGVGALMIRNSFGGREGEEMDVTSGVPLLLTALSISLDSLAVGMALPGVGIPLIPLLITVSISTTSFTLVGLTFGSRLGARYEVGAERAAGAILILLAIGFTLERIV